MSSRSSAPGTSCAEVGGVDVAQFVCCVDDDTTGIHSQARRLVFTHNIRRDTSHARTAFGRSGDLNSSLRLLSAPEWAPRESVCLCAARAKMKRLPHQLGVRASELAFIINIIETGMTTRTPSSCNTHAAANTSDAAEGIDHAHSCTSRSPPLRVRTRVSPTSAHIDGRRINLIDPHARARSQTS